ncbi:MAG: dUTP diphosphatase [Calditerrivibrio sp.]|nr:dUTP diphosphatase [Calditerrivibrio sp.]MCA1932044.1 dUTP diphosphatase [Calditerrivibrio sp.]
MCPIEVKIKCAKGISLPRYITEGSAGMDLSVISDGVIKKGEIKLLPTGIYMEIPEGYEAQIRPRSGLALKYGVTVLNSPGTIDSDYRGEIGVILANFGKDDFEYKKGDRIAQIVFNRVVKVNFVVVYELAETERGDGGFGHSGR